MLNLLKQLLGKYKSFVVKKHIDASKSKLAQENLDLGLPCILPMLEVVHTLIKYGQRWDVFICEFINAM
jgi:hypothetical protein